MRYTLGPRPAVGRIHVGESMKRSQYTAIAAVAFALVIVAVVVAVSISIGSDDTTGARAQAQAACAVVSEWETNNGGKLNTNDMLYSIQQDADKAASGDHQWQFLAEDAANLKSAYILGEQSLSGGSGLATPNMAFGAAVRQIETDCTHVQ